MELKKAKGTLILVFFLFLTLTSVSALTASIGNSRMVLRVDPNETVERSILIMNTNNIPVNISLSKDQDSHHNLTLTEKDFTLLPNEEKRVYFTISAFEDGTFTSYIHVTYSDINDSSNNVGLSTTIITSPKITGGSGGGGGGSGGGTSTMINFTNAVNISYLSNSTSIAPIFFPGEEIVIEIEFIAQGNYEGLIIVGNIDELNRGDEIDNSDVFNISNGTHYKKNVKMFLPDDIRQGGYEIDLYLKNNEGYKKFSSNILIIEKPNENVQPEIKINGFKDYGIDEDGDGLYEFLAIEVDLTVPSDGTYEFDGDFKDSFLRFGRYNYELKKGKNTVILLFSGPVIQSKLLNQSYTLEELRIELYGTNDFDLQLEDNIYTTHSYNYTEFETDNINFTGSPIDFAVDSDGDGTYDFITIEVEVNVTKKGDYIFRESLFYRNQSNGYVEIDVGLRKVLYLEEGVHRVQFNFSGEQLSLTNFSGPFTVISRVENIKYSEIDTKGTRIISETSAYNYRDFNTLPFNDYAVDIDNDGLNDYLVLEFNETFDDSGSCYLDSTLIGFNTGSIINNVNQRINVTSGENTIKVLFSSWEINKLNNEQKFFLNDLDFGCDEKSLQIDNNYDLYKYYIYETKTYSSGNFSSPGFFDYPIDSNSDGIYDLLAIDINITVPQDGTYTIYGSLEGSNNKFYSKEDFRLFNLTSGKNVITLYFDGRDMYLNDETESYFLDWLRITLDNRREHYESLRDLYTTNIYDSSDYVSPGLTVLENFSDFGLDTDREGLFEYLVIKIPVDVKTSGNYTFDTSLDELSYSQGGHVRKTVSLTEDDSFVLLYFPGNKLYEAGYSRVYRFDDLQVEDNGVEVYDGNEADLSYYSYDQFDPVIETTEEPGENFAIEATLLKGKKAGEEWIVQATVYNINHKVDTFDIDVSGYSEWASLINLQPRSFELSPGESQDINFTFYVNDDIFGLRTFSFDLSSNGKSLEKQDIALSISGIGASVDTTSPAIALQNPSNGQSTTDDDILFSYIPSDESTISYCELFINNLQVAKTTDIINNSENYFAQTLSRDDYTWYITCTDEYGNIGQSSTRSFEIKKKSSSGGGGGGRSSSSNSNVQYISNSAQNNDDSNQNEATVSTNDLVSEPISLGNTNSLSSHEETSNNNSFVIILAIIVICLLLAVLFLFVK